jgi:hypothetical protein
LPFTFNRRSARGVPDYEHLLTATSADAVSEDIGATGWCGETICLSVEASVQLPARLTERSLEPHHHPSSECMDKSQMPRSHIDANGDAAKPFRSEWFFVIRHR